MTSPLAALRKIAEGMTPGEMTRQNAAHVSQVAIEDDWCIDVYGDRSENIAEHIVAFDRETCLALITVVEAGDAVNARLGDQIEAIGCNHSYALHCIDCDEPRNVSNAYDLARAALDEQLGRASSTATPEPRGAPASPDTRRR